MKKITSIFGLKMLIASLLLLPNLVFAVTVEDVVGRKVEIPNKVERILLGEGRLFHAIALLEGDKPFDRIAGWQGDFKKLDIQSYEVYKEKFPQIDDIPLIGSTTADSISNEKVIMLNPDIAIFGLSGHGPGKDSALVGLLEKMGVPVIFVDFRSHPMKNTLKSIDILGKALDREDKADEYISFYKKTLEDIESRVKDISDNDKTSVFIEMKAGTSNDCCLSVGNGNMGEFIDVAGGNNIAKPLLPGVFGSLNLETVLTLNPDVYILSGVQTNSSKNNGIKLGAMTSQDDSLSNVEFLLSRNVIKDLDAVKEGRVSAIWHSYYNSPYNILAIQNFAKWFYPEIFSDIDVEKTREYIHKNFLAIPATGTFWVDHFSVKK